MLSCLKSMRAAFALLLCFTVLLGGVYPFCVSVISRLLFQQSASGSLITRQEKVIGSELLGQCFLGAEYFWGRPSASACNATLSGGSNLSPGNPASLVAIKERILRLRAADPKNQARIPIELVTSSASGLDPHISPEAAYFQVSRVARARGMQEKELRKLIADDVQGRQFGVFGQPRVNVLRLNMVLDSMQKVQKK